MSEHFASVNVPTETEEKLTIPVGADFVPAAVSVTVTLHVAVCETTTEPQLTATDVARALTTNPPEPAAVACVASPP